MKTAKTDLKVMTLAGSDAAMLENNAGAAAAESNNFSASVALPKGSAPLIEISTAVDEQCQASKGDSSVPQDASPLTETQVESTGFQPAATVPFQN